MSHLDEYMKDAEEHNLGNDIKDYAKGKAKGAAKKAVMKPIKKGINALMEKTGLNAVKAAAKQGAKAALKAAGTAAKAGLKAFFSFLISNPIGWVIGLILIVVVVGILSSIGSETTLKEETVATTTLTEGDTSLSDDEVAIIMGDCPETVVEIGEVDEDATTLRNAQQLYSVFKSYGLTDECIAGILGNLSVESGIDPTGIEGIYDEDFQIGPKKQEAIADLSAYTTGTVFPLYASSGISINQSAYQGSDGNYYCGLGLIQWTGPGAEKFVKVADSVGVQWYTMQYQLAYMVGDTHYRSGFFAEWKAAPDSSPEDAATTFAHDYEGNTVMAQEERRTAARDWYNQMSSWTVDEALANSVLALAQSMGGEANDDAAGESADRCNTNSAYDNSNMASAAVSYAYATKAEGNGNNGTELYQTLINNIFGDGIYMSCDHGVAAAVRWSGSDDTYPSGNTNHQYDYLQSSPKWQSIGMSGSVSMEDLAPGDVFILDGHTFMYVGHEIIEQVHGANANENADSVSASFGERSPGCGNDATNIVVTNGGMDWDPSRGQYEIFRCVQPDNSTTYQNAGSDSVIE